MQVYRRRAYSRWIVEFSSRWRFTNCAAHGAAPLLELDEADGDQLCGRRIFVLSPQGDTLQVFMHPEGLLFDRICGFDGKLLVTYRAYVEDGDGERHLEVAGVMGLRGL